MTRTPIKEAFNCFMQLYIIPTEYLYMTLRMPTKIESHDQYRTSETWQFWQVYIARHCKA